MCYFVRKKNSCIRNCDALHFVCDLVNFFLPGFLKLMGTHPSHMSVKVYIGYIYGMGGGDFIRVGMFFDLAESQIKLL